MNNSVAPIAFIIGVVIGCVVGVGIGIINNHTPSLICAQPHLKDGKAICAVYVNKDAVGK